MHVTLKVLNVYWNCFGIAFQKLCFEKFAREQVLSMKIVMEPVRNL